MTTHLPHRNVARAPRLLSEAFDDLAIKSTKEKKTSLRLAWRTILGCATLSFICLFLWGLGNESISASSLAPNNLPLYSDAALSFPVKPALSLAPPLETVVPPEGKVK